MSFGGHIKLLGESEYRNALKQITSALKTTSSALKAQAVDFTTNNKAMTSSTDAEKKLTAAIKDQKTAITQAESSYAKYSVALQAQQTKHNALTKEYKAAVLELERIKKASGETSDEYKKQAEKVADLEGKLVESTDEMNRSKKAMSDLKSEISSATKTMNAAEKEVDNLGKETQETGEQAEKAKEGFTVFKGVVANLASQAIGAAVAGLKKLGGVIVDVGKQSISSYAEYEQLVGGVETLFKDSAGVVEEYAQNAYKTAQISANEYMETVTSFSASLLQGLNGDTAKAAKIADMAIIDMSDNANKMGTSMEMIQNAYQGFAKDNYTMLDNLKLGYGGTQAEAARLINDTKVMGDTFKATAKNVKDVPFDKFIEAIHKVQEQMGITGTSALEASGTIEGSTRSMKAAWDNLLVAIADDNADLGKSIDIFVENAIGAFKNTVPKIKNIVDNFKKLGNSIVTEIFPRIKREIPQLRPLIETFEWFIKNKGAVVGALKAMVAAFAVSKILSFSKGLSDVTKSLIDVAKGVALATTATNANTAAEAANTAGKVAATGATGALTVATNLLNAAWKANPIGLIVTGLSVLVGVIGSVIAATNKLTDAEKAQQEIEKQQAAEWEEQKARIEDNTTSWNELVQSRQNALDTSMTEIANLQSLYDELQNITEENGRIKEGYEERANFIVTQLNQALGTEISITDGVIQKNKELEASIDQLIEKKRASVLLESQEALYNEAIAQQSGAVDELIAIEKRLTDKQSEMHHYRNQLRTKEQRLMELSNKAKQGLLSVDESSEKQSLEFQIERINEKIAAKQRETDDIQAEYNKQSELFSQYAYNIRTYEDNLKLFHEGNYSAMTQATWEYSHQFQDATNAEIATLEDKIAKTDKMLKEYEQLNDESNNNMYAKDIENAKKQKAALEDKLNAMKSATKKGLDETKIIWSDSLDEQLSEITGRDIQFSDAGNGLVQMFADGEKVGAPRTKDEVAIMMTTAVKELTAHNGEATKAGEDIIDGFNNGVKNPVKQGGVFTNIWNFGKTLLARLRASLQEKSPSKATYEMGKFLIDGFNAGFINNESKALKEVAGFGTNIISTMNGELTKTLSMPNVALTANIAKINTPQQITDPVTKTDSMVSAFKTALSQMKIVLDDNVAGQFVEQTVARAIYR